MPRSFGVVGDVGQDDDCLVSGDVQAEVGGVAAGLSGVSGNRLPAFPGGDLPEVPDAGVRLVGRGGGLQGAPHC